MLLYVSSNDRPVIQSWDSDSEEAPTKNDSGGVDGSIPSNLPPKENRNIVILEGQKERRQQGLLTLDTAKQKPAKRHVLLVIAFFFYPAIKGIGKS